MPYSVTRAANGQVIWNEADDRAATTSGYQSPGMISSRFVGGNGAGAKAREGGPEASGGWG